MRRTLADLVTVVLLVTLCARTAGADGHIVSRAVMQARLNQAAEQRAADLSTVSTILASEDGAWAALKVGVDPRLLSEGVVILSDEELRDLSHRVTLLQTDPVAAGAVKALIIIGIIVVLVVVVLVIAVDRAACALLCQM